MPPPPANSSCPRNTPSVWRILLAVFFSLLLFAVTLKIPVSHSDAEIDTVGRISYCGFPLPCIQYADGISIMQSLGSAKVWLLHVNLAFWTVLSALLFRLRTLRHFILCLALAQAPLLLLLLWLCP